MKKRNSEKPPQEIIRDIMREPEVKASVDAIVAQCYDELIARLTPDERAELERRKAIEEN